MYVSWKAKAGCWAVDGDMIHSITQKLGRGSPLTADNILCKNQFKNLGD